jgi:ADP-ribosyl-[dinitrogen reductase] hydrolase
MEPPEDFPRMHPGTSAGTWSDDGAQALALLEALRGQHIVEPLAARLMQQTP